MYAIIDSGVGYEIHRSGCSHNRRGLHEVMYETSAASADAALREFLDGNDVSPSDCRVMPCTRTRK